MDAVPQRCRKGGKMRTAYLLVAACLAVGFGIVLQAVQGPAPGGARGQGGGRGGGAAKIETLEGVANAEEIAATHGVDVIILGNNDLSSFSGWSQNDPRYQDAIIKVHNAALKYGKFYGNAGSQYMNGYTVSAGTRMVQNGPARDGWAPPRGGRGAPAAAPAGGRGNPLPDPDPEPVIGLPGGAQPGTTAPAAPRGRGGQ
jgi:hypothetical protein